ncbi:MAG: hypothetical protein RKO24_17415 [Candidatus Competibacter sp.]|nr:hypothetical protein [Candidatus Competibacter sp.]
MSSKMELNVLSIKPWKVKDEETGQEKTGATVFVGQDANPSSGILGMEIMKFSISMDLYDKCRLLGLEIPGEYECEVSLRLGGAGKGVLQLVSIGA